MGGEGSSRKEMDWRDMEWEEIVKRSEEKREETWI